MIDGESNIVRVAALSILKAKVKANERTAKEVSAEISARMEAERSERERTEF